MKYIKSKGDWGTGGWGNGGIEAAKQNNVSIIRDFLQSRVFILKKM